MMRDHRKLRAFDCADELALMMYKVTVSFPRDELFGLTSQMRRGAVSIASNIVEGCARQSEADYLRFLDMAYSAAKELEYQLSLAFRLGYIAAEPCRRVTDLCDKTAGTLNALLASYRRRSRKPPKGTA
jgi:four helix bundle protein